MRPLRVIEWSDELVSAVALCTWSDVLIEVEDVVRVVTPLESGEPSQLVCRVCPTDATFTLIGKHIDVYPARVRLKYSAVPAGGGHTLAILCCVGPASSGYELNQRVAVTEGAVFVRCRRDRAAIALQ